ncbi:MAG TPA: pirin family protein [Pseudomonadales bacterium]|nr:pirin family protein [Pseudomonadales bacterium]
MTWHASVEPVCSEREDDIEVLIASRSHDPGGFAVRRVLPAAARSQVGPFVFFDEIGPAVFAPGEGIEVRPHPHIGLATITYLFEGEILHRDSLGITQAIQPGAVNLMTAGRGIVHSERTDPERTRSGQRLHGIQTWLALPEDLQETEPAFVHHPAASMARFDEDGVRGTVVVGSAFGKESPVRTASPALYLDLQLEADARLGLPKATERALYVVSGQVRMGGCVLEPGTMAVLRPDRMPLLRALQTSRVLLLGGDPVGPRTLWWNFVSSDPDRIARARADWDGGRFAAIDDDPQRIPLPEA